MTRRALAIRSGSLLFSLGASLFLVALLGHPPRTALAAISRAFRTSWGLEETLLRATPLVLSSVGVALAARMSLWNIGAQGQMAVGAIAATAVARSLPEAPGALVLPASLVLGLAAGALFAAIPGILKATLDVSEVLVTLLSTYVALELLRYLVLGPWQGADRFTYTDTLARNAWLPTLPGSRIHAGVLLFPAVALAFWLALSRTVWGYEVRVTGDSPVAARTAGIRVKLSVVLVLALSGALSGLAGAIELTGRHHRLQADALPEYGFTAILVAWLADRSLPGSLVVGILFAGLLVAGDEVQVALSLPQSTILVFQAIVLLSVLAGDALLRRGSSR